MLFWLSSMYGTVSSLLQLTAIRGVIGFSILIQMGIHSTGEEFRIDLDLRPSCRASGAFRVDTARYYLDPDGTYGKYLAKICQGTQRRFSAMSRSQRL
ncbi:uncharacterized protein EV420DRAFT_1155965 [Desarmillaria tabescens]|uniref:Uncharacterized protein n=1 Tax=Armillaria tabescens TaxID=1929756 RepID=A0AA39TQL8_ARMTA|nr:uncharacterized protein EV420DRAFT_1155965 [Desarmillaria tabescens]KAK0463093.1 hypothetical protein EV420DRAFT_1155965 [Desarmillaria tabescens]